MKPIPRIRCPRCGGVGQVTMPAKLVRVLECLRSRGTSTDAATVLASLCKIEPKPVGITAINNRLETLRSLELVTRQRKGKYQFYTAVPTDPSLCFP